MNQRGAGLIIVIVILLVVGVVLAVFVSLINTESYTAMNQSAALESFGIADGGIEYALKTGLFPNYSLPPYSGRGATPDIALGDGSFFVDPPTVLTAPTGVANPTPAISVVSTAGFADPAVTGSPAVYITIDSEVMSCTGVTATTFTGCTRGAVPPPSIANHPVDSGVYPITTLLGAVPGGAPGCGVASISVNQFAKRDSTAGFLPTGIIGIGSEQIHYTGVTPGPGDSVMAFTGITRCYRGSCTCPGAPGHSDGKLVYQYVITSTGTVPLPILGNAQRVVRVTLEVLD